MKTLRQVSPNKGVETEYRKRLNKLIDAMNKSVLYWILADYGNRTAKDMAKAIQKRIKQWKKVFGNKADDMALWFVDSMKRHTLYGFKRALNEKNLNPNIRIPQNISNAIQLENASLIRSIPEKYFESIGVVAMMSVLYNWEKDKLEENIIKKYEIAKRRVKIIASDQTKKTNALMKLAICNDLDIEYGKWVYTYRSEQPRESHVRMNGRIFDLRKGCYDEKEGRFIFPSELYNCKCDFRPVIEEPGEDLRN